MTEFGPLLRWRLWLLLHQSYFGAVNGAAWHLLLLLLDIRCGQPLVGAGLMNHGTVSVHGLLRLRLRHGTVRAAAAADVVVMVMKYLLLLLLHLVVDGTVWDVPRPARVSRLRRVRRDLRGGWVRGRQTGRRGLLLLLRVTISPMRRLRRWPRRGRGAVCKRVRRSWWDLSRDVVLLVEVGRVDDGGRGRVVGRGRGNLTNCCVLRQGGR